MGLSNRDTFSWDGEWRVVGSRQTVHGTLHYSPDGIRLTLGRRLVRHGSKPRDFTVVGITGESKYVSCFGGYVSRNGTSIGDAGVRETQELRFESILIGMSASLKSKFPAIEFTSPMLAGWLDPAEYPISREVTEGPEPRISVETYKGTRVLLKALTTVPCPGHVELVARHTIDRTRPPSRVTLIRTPWMRFVPRRAQSLSVLTDMMHRLARSVELLAGQPFLPSDVVVTLPRSPVAHSGRSYPVPDEEMPWLTVPTGPQRVGSTHPSRVPIRFRDLSQEEFSRLVERWLAPRSPFRSPWGIFREVWGERVILESQVALLAQAFEGFHRRAFPHEDAYVSKEEYAPLLSAMRTAIPHEIQGIFRQALCSGLEYGYQLSLRQRLKRLVDCIPKPLLQVMTKKKLNSWIQEFVLLRNHVAHFPVDFEGVDEDVAGAIRVCEYAGLILYVHFLLAAGFSESLVVEAAQRTSQWGFLEHNGHIPSGRVRVSLADSKDAGEAG